MRGLGLQSEVVRQTREPLCVGGEGLDDGAGAAGVVREVDFAGEGAVEVVVGEDGNAMGAVLGVG